MCVQSRNQNVELPTFLLVLTAFYVMDIYVFFRYVSMCIDNSSDDIVFR